MNGNILRRRMTGVKEDKLLYPDAYMAVFTCAANTYYDIMYGNSLKKTILDGVEVSSVKPTTGGKHTLYFWLKTSDRLEDWWWSGAPEYIRIPGKPVGWHVAFIHYAAGLRQIDFLGETPPAFDTLFCDRVPDLQKIRVPIGCRDAYVAALSNTGIKNKTNIIVETRNFSYNIT